jgi:4-hydroxybenzoyl-CoA thioesterase
VTKTFTLKRQVEFNHCDMAGIVFYPRYFEMISSSIERFFADAMEFSWGEMRQTGGGMGTPMGSIDVRFRAPSRLGEWLEFTVFIKRLGTSSSTFNLTCVSDGETRFTGSATVVYANTSTGKSAPWPDSLRSKMSTYLMSPTP